MSDTVKAAVIIGVCLFFVIVIDLIFFKISWPLITEYLTHPIGGGTIEILPEAGGWEMR